MAGFDERQIHTAWFGGTANMTCTLNNAAATFDWTISNNKARHRATIAATAHAFSTGSHIYIEGSTAYNGLWQILAAAANSFTILEPTGGSTTFAAETFAGTETGMAALGFAQPWQLLEFRLKMSATGGAVENFTVSLDANKGAAWDDLIFSQGMNATQYVRQSYTFEDGPWFDAGDVLEFAYANTNSRTWGLTVKYRLGAN